jgi:hypothetical protein
MQQRLPQVKVAYIEEVIWVFAKIVLGNGHVRYGCGNDVKVVAFHFCQEEDTVDEVTLITRRWRGVYFQRWRYTHEKAGQVRWKVDKAANIERWRNPGGHRHLIGASQLQGLERL